MSVKSSSKRDVSSPVLLWFRRDLRLLANPALHHAAEVARSNGSVVVPLFVLDPSILGAGRANRMAFLYEALRALRTSGVPLVVRFGLSNEVVPAAAAEFGAGQVVCAGDFSPLGRARDERVETVLGRSGVAFQRIGSPYLVNPGTVRKGDGTPFKVFTPFRRVWEQRIDEAAELYSVPRSPGSSDLTVPWLAADDRQALGMIPDAPDGCSATLPVASEDAAMDRLQQFVEDHLRTYDVQRNNPAADATSRLSADLKFGLLHPAQIVPFLASGGVGADVFRSELGWREFYADVLWHHPRSAHHSFNASMEAIEVNAGRVAEMQFDAWSRGLTGYPFVDAGMRQLLAEGWMHNRMRMVTASFLVKDLHIDWRRGAAWFMEHLVDADVASNQHGWQWTAGTGTDAAPYYRIFNPISQGKKFDPTGAYIRRYVPELKALDDTDIHEPWNANGGGLFGGLEGYPAPIVDHAVERREALDRLAALKVRPSA